MEVKPNAGVPSFRGARGGEAIVTEKLPFVKNGAVDAVPKKHETAPAAKGLLTRRGGADMFLSTMVDAVKHDDTVGKSDLVVRLRAAGLRPTRQRLLIAGLLLDGRHRHVSADGLAREIRETGTHMAGGTVYNTLNQFTDAGLLRRVTVHNEHSVFDTNTDHHHHFYDSDRDQLIDIPADQVTLADLPGAPDGHDIRSVDVLIHITSRGD